VTRSRRAASPRGRRDALALPARGPLRGEAKLQAALREFGVGAEGRVALDVGAAAGGFTRVLLDAGAARVYAVDTGHGQLLGSLRQDPRVVNLEATNVGELTSAIIADALDVITVDVSYLALSQAVAQLDRVTIAPGADLIGLVKPMFELRMGTAPVDQETARRAADHAATAIEAAGWNVLAVIDSPVAGARGAVEMLLHARCSEWRESGVWKARIP
jgi:23S rRNA (cytidine1920-2'-O)/16S rRNA (cytidine1409-2'-O)-methyltransferase